MATNLQILFDKLPSVEFPAGLPDLPCESGVYLVVDNQGFVFYVGASSSIRRRWKSHNLKRKLNELREEEGRPSFCVLYVVMDDYWPLEGTLIQELRPPLNRSGKGPKRGPFRKLCPVILDHRAFDHLEKVKQQDDEYCPPYRRWGLPLDRCYDGQIVESLLFWFAGDVSSFLDSPREIQMAIKARVKNTPPSCFDNDGEFLGEDWVREEKAFRAILGATKELSINLGI